VVRRITALLNHHARPVHGTRILLLGIAYKAATSDWRESPSVAVAERLHALGAELQACDPHIPTVLKPGLTMELVELSPEALAAADLVLVLVDHPEFDPDVICRHARLVFDAKGILRGRSFAGEIL
jgi:UDP-N-acetyl-D-mannosaminuronate dehydrogenase